MAKGKTYGFIDIEKFRGIKYDLHIGEQIQKNAETMVEYLKDNSPESKKRKDARKRYSHKWTYKYYPQYEMAVVYNKKGNLTYLLEHGHIIATKKGGAGWSPPRPHIQKAMDVLPESMNKIINQTDIDFEIY